MTILHMDSLYAYADADIRSASAVPSDMAAAGYSAFNITGSAYFGLKVEQGEFYRLFGLDTPDPGNVSAYGDSWLFGYLMPKGSIPAQLCFSFAVTEKDLAATFSRAQHGIGISASNGNTGNRHFQFSRGQDGIFGISFVDPGNTEKGAFPFSMPPDVWYSDEPNRVELVLNFTTDTAQAWINGNKVLEITAAGVSSTFGDADLYLGVKTTAQRYSCGRMLFGNPVVSDVLVGPCTIRRRLPSVDVETTFVSDNGGANFSRINTLPPDGDSSFVEGVNEGDADLYRYSPVVEISGGRKILAVRQVAISRRQSADPRYLATRVGDVKTDTAAEAPFGSYGPTAKLMNINPATGVEWTSEDLNNTPFGFEIRDSIDG